jgi:ABC-2 type transport system permease protein
MRARPMPKARALAATSRLRTAFVVFANEAHRRILDRSALVNLLVAPFVLSSILGLAFGHSGSGLVRIGIAYEHPSPLQRELVAAGVRAAALPPQVRLVALASPATVRRQVASGALDAGIVVPRSFANLRAADLASAATTAQHRQEPGARQLPSPAGPSRAVAALRDALRAPTKAKAAATHAAADAAADAALAGALVDWSKAPALVRVDVVAPSSSALGSQVADGIASAIASRWYAGLLVATTGGLGTAHSSSPSALAASALAAGASPTPLDIAERHIGGNDTIGYFAPSMAVIFLFIGAGLGTRALVLERATGTLARLAAAPVRSGAVVAGKVLAVFATSLGSVLLLWGETEVLFGASWGDPIGVLMVVVAVAAAMCGLAILLTSLSRDENQAFTASVVVGVILGLLGGNFFPPGSLPTFLQDASLATPNGWALVAFGRLSLEHLSWHAAVGPSLVLAGIAVALGLASVMRVGKVVSL